MLCLYHRTVEGAKSDYVTSELQHILSICRAYGFLLLKRVDSVHFFGVGIT